MSDIKAFEHFIISRGRRTDMGPEFVNSMIDVIARRIADPEFAEKKKDYQSKLKYYQAVKRVMEVA